MAAFSQLPIGRGDQVATKFATLSTALCVIVSLFSEPFVSSKSCQLDVIRQRFFFRLSTPHPRGHVSLVLHIHFYEACYSTRANKPIKGINIYWRERFYHFRCTISVSQLPFLKRKTFVSYFVFKILPERVAAIMAFSITVTGFSLLI